MRREQWTYCAHGEVSRASTIVLRDHVDQDRLPVRPKRDSVVQEPIHRQSPYVCAPLRRVQMENAPDRPVGDEQAPLTLAHAAQPRLRGGPGYADQRQYPRRQFLQKADAQGIEKPCLHESERNDPPYRFLAFSSQAVRHLRRLCRTWAESAHRSAA